MGNGLRKYESERSLGRTPQRFMLNVVQSTQPPAHMPIAMWGPAREGAFANSPKTQQNELSERRKFACRMQRLG